MTNGERRPDCRWLGALRQAREEVQPLDVLLRRPRLARIRIVGGADVAAVTNGRLHHQRHPGVGTAHRDRRAEERRRGDAHNRERRTVDGQGLADGVRRARQTALPVAVADDDDRVAVERAIVVGRQEPSSLRPLPEHAEVLPRDELDGTALGCGRGRRAARDEAARRTSSSRPRSRPSPRARREGGRSRATRTAATCHPGGGARPRTSDRAQPPGGCAARSHSRARTRPPRRRSRAPATRRRRP